MIPANGGSGVDSYSRCRWWAGTVHSVRYGAVRDERLIGDRTLWAAGVIATQLERDIAAVAQPSCVEHEWYVAAVVQESSSSIGSWSSGEAATVGPGVSGGSPAPVHSQSDVRGDEDEYFRNFSVFEQDDHRQRR